MKTAGAPALLTKETGLSFIPLRLVSTSPHGDLQNDEERAAVPARSASQAR